MSSYLFGSYCGAAPARLGSPDATAADATTARYLRNRVGELLSIKIMCSTIYILHTYLVYHLEKINYTYRLRAL